MLHACIDGVFNPVIALIFQLVSQFGTAGLYDASVIQYVHKIWRDVIKYPLIMGHQYHCVLSRTKQVDTVGYYAQGVDIQT